MGGEPVAMVDLKLPKLPDRTPVKFTFAATPDLAADLALYLDLYRSAYDDKAATVADLIPSMLAGFLDSDRAFRSARRGSPERSGDGR
jgi:hypothetical protein